MAITRRDYLIIGVLTGVALSAAAALFVLDARSPATNTEYLLDTDGCKAAQRLGVELKIDNGMCAVRAEGDHGQHLFLAGGARVSQNHVLGSRSVK